jgi:hypothetical protein
MLHLIRRAGRSSLKPSIQCAAGIRIHKCAMYTWATCPLLGKSLLCPGRHSVAANDSHEVENFWPQLLLKFTIEIGRIGTRSSMRLCRRGCYKYQEYERCRWGVRCWKNVLSYRQPHDQNRRSSLLSNGSLWYQHAFMGKAQRLFCVCNSGFGTARVTTRYICLEPHLSMFAQEAN